MSQRPGLESTEVTNILLKLLDPLPDLQATSSPYIQEKILNPLQDGEEKKGVHVQQRKMDRERKWQVSLMAMVQLIFGKVG